MAYDVGHSIRFSKQLDEPVAHKLYLPGTRIVFPKFVESKWDITPNVA